MNTEFSPWRSLAGGFNDPYVCCLPYLLWILLRSITKQTAKPEVMQGRRAKENESVYFIYVCIKDPSKVRKGSYGTLQ